LTALALLHGVGLDRTMWHRFEEIYPGQTVSYDLLGLGNAPKPAGPYRLAHYVEQFEAELTRAGQVGPVDIVGFSMGALVAQAVALAFSERVQHLVLVSGVFNRTVAERDSIVARVAEVRSGGYVASIEPALSRWFTPTFAAQHPETVEAVRVRMLPDDVPAYANAYEVFATGDAELSNAVQRITAPTLIITGEDDQRSTPAMAHALAAAIPSARAIIMPAVRHLVPLETPEVLVQLISKFTTVEANQ
jgi:(E)-2-((N-methylformamido)methylene)succinate hydrolase